MIGYRVWISRVRLLRVPRDSNRATASATRPTRRRGRNEAVLVQDPGPPAHGRGADADFSDHAQVDSPAHATSDAGFAVPSPPRPSVSAGAVSYR